jgi:hypothetical protein
VVLLAKKHAIAALAIAFLMALPAALWASMMRPTVNVDFDHSVNIGTAVVPPGHYQLVELTGDTNKPVFDVRTMQGKSMGMTNIGFSVATENGGTIPATRKKTDILLKRINGDYYLSQIWIQGRHRGWQFPLPANVKQEASNAPMEHVTGTLAR